MFGRCEMDGRKESDGGTEGSVEDFGNIVGLEDTLIGARVGASVGLRLGALTVGSGVGLDNS